MRRHSFLAVPGLLSFIFVVACGSSATPTPTRPPATAIPTVAPTAPPTSTSVPPTATATAAPTATATAAPTATATAAPTATATAAPTATASAAPAKAVVSIADKSSSGQTGQATLTAQGDKTEVVINITAAAPGVGQPAIIHERDCTAPAPGPAKARLTNVVDGKSTTVVDVPLATLQSAPFSLWVHKSTSEAGIFVACGVIPVK